MAALDGGADDYVTKPFGMAELEARIRTALRHRTPEPGEAPPSSIAVGPLELDLVHHEARMEGTPVDLTAKEFDVLSFLARHAGRTCTCLLYTSARGRGHRDAAWQGHHQLALLHSVTELAASGQDPQVVVAAAIEDLRELLFLRDCSFTSRCV